MIAVMIHSTKLWKLTMSPITGVAASCMPICHGVGWPSPASAAPAPANRAATVAAMAVKRDNTFIGLLAPCF